MFTYLSKGTEGISTQNLKDVFGRSTQFVISDRQWTALIQEVKGDNEGDEIEFEEFKAYMIEMMQ